MTLGCAGSSGNAAHDDTVDDAGATDGSGSAGDDEAAESDAADEATVGSADSSDDGNDDGPGEPASGAFPSGLVVASPTASLGGMGMPPPGMPLVRTIDELTNGPRVQGATIQRGKPYAQKQAELAAMLDGSACELLFGDIGGFNPMCYGPSLDYQNHPDAMDAGMANGQLPGGDLGLWSATEPDGQACAASKLNGLVDDVALRVDYGLYLAANLQCLMVVDGVAPPDVGASLDRTTSVHASLSASNPGVVVSLATLAREPDVDGRSAYLYELQLSIPSMAPDPLEMHAWVRHEASLADATEYRGRIWSRFDHQPPMNDVYAHTLDYANDADGLRYDVVGAAFPEGTPDPFDAEGTLDFSAPWHGNATRAAVELDPETGAATLAFAWQAGHFDDKSRVFNVSTEFDAPDHGMGCGFFGFGAPFAGSAADAAISTFICNWAGPGNSHAGEVGFAQKQCMETDAMGKFVPTASHIGYGPVNDCDTTTDPAFMYRVPNEIDYSDEPLARDLVELATDADYAEWAPPAAP